MGKELDPEKYVTARDLHSHAPMFGGEITFNYNDALFQYWADKQPEMITASGLSLNEDEKISNWIDRVYPPKFPSSDNLDTDWVLPDDDPRRGHKDNPKYQPEFFKAYQKHGHTPYEGGPIIWNSKQWANQWNAKFYLLKQILPKSIKEAIETHFSYLKEPSVIPSGNAYASGNIIPFNEHSHSIIEGGPIAQNEWMETAISNARLEKFKNATQLEFNFGSALEYKDEPYNESVLFEESEKSGPLPKGQKEKGVLQITASDNPFGSTEKKVYNPTISIPSFGGELIFNDKQLAIVLNKLIDQGLIRRKDGNKFTVPDKPTKAYNVHHHSGPFDGGTIIASGMIPHSHAGVTDASGVYLPGENYAYGCMAPWSSRDHPDTWELYKLAEALK